MSRLYLGAVALLILAFCACGSANEPRSADTGVDASVTADASAAPRIPRPESYAAVVDIIDRSCGYIRCHAGTPVGGALSLLRGEDHASSLVGIPACEYPRMNRVEPYDPEHSWVMLKLTAAFRGRDDPYANYIYFEPDPDWDPNDRNCRDQTDDGTPLFGCRMPLTAPNMLPEDDIETIRAWIAEGAPHER